MSALGSDELVHDVGRGSRGHEKRHVPIALRLVLPPRSAALLHYDLPVAVWSFFTVVVGYCLVFDGAEHTVLSTIGW